MDKNNIDISKIHCTFLGLPTLQSFAVFFIFEKILLDYPFKRIVELGTGQGGLALYLSLYCINKNAEFHTYDIEEINITTKDILLSKIELKKYCKTKDIFENKEEIIAILKKEGRTILFCDNGDKILEFNTFAPHLKKGDIIGVHDWDEEIKLTDIQETLQKCQLKPIFEQECVKYDKDGARFFLRS